MSSTPSSPIVRVGVAGWQFPHWDRYVYPRPKPRSFHPLEFLAERFDVVEAPQPFYDYPRPELTRLWASKVEHNPRFQFTVRLHRDFTHERSLDAAKIKAFSEGLEPLAKRGKLGCVLMQFPSAFRFNAENKDFLIRLRREFHRFPLVAELRHGSWATEEGVGTLIDYHISFCNLDQPEGVRATPPTSYLTWRLGYVKLHGRQVGPAHDAFDDRSYRVTGNDYLYSLAQLEQWKARIARFAPHAEATYVIFNNDASGKSVINALQMQSVIQGVERPVAKPPAVVIPIRPVEVPAAPVQQSLFAA
ncbi:MAG: DUF72 domain-containing protein [Bryobacteraceae bacterium]